MTPRIALTLGRVAAAGVLLATVVAGCGPFGDTSPMPTVVPRLSLTPAPPAPTVPVDADAEVAPTPRPDPRGEPARVVIPAIDVDAALVGVGLARDGSMQVPDFGLAGWYTEGPRPGHPGPSVIVAHVDSQGGPDVFHRLDELARGDEIHVLYASGDRVTFVMTWSEQTPKDDLPVDSLWPVTTDRLLALVTCGGQFDRSTRHYRDNVIVYASPTSTSPS